MMQIDIKAAVMLLVTLLLGVALGALGVGALSRERNDQVRQLRRPNGFVAHMEEVIQPRDSMQRAAIATLLQETAARNDSILRGTNAQLRAALETMRTSLVPLLDSEQNARLAEAARLAPPIGGGQRGGGPRGDGPPRRGGPPPGEGRPGPDGPPPRP